MSAPNSAAKRFTHDWMIRFIELHPIETCFSTRTTRFGPFRPEQSPYDSISPYFKNLLRRYMPVIITAFKLTFKKEKIMIKYRYDSEKEEFTLPFHGKAVVIMSSIKFGGTDAGTLTKYLEKRVFCIDAAFVSGKNASFTPAEFVYLAKHTKEDFRFYKCTLTEQVSLTTAWPLIKRLEEIELYVKNLGIDEHTKQTVLHKPSEVRVTGFILYIECVSEDVIMAFVDCFLSCPVFPMMFEWRLISELESFDFKPVSEKIREKLIAAGYEQDESNGDNMNVLLPDDYVGNSVVVTTIDKLYHIIVLPRD